MPKNSPIIIVDDDLEDLELYNHALNNLKVKNKIILFSSSLEALEFLKVNAEPIFFIMCDVNMPHMNGIELREELNKDNALMLKTIPFLFLSTSSHISHIFSAYNRSIQGYFSKPSDFELIQEMFASIISYWSSSLHPYQ